MSDENTEPKKPRADAISDSNSMSTSVAWSTVDSDEPEFSSGGITAAARRFLKPEDIDPAGPFADWPVWLVAGTTFLSGLVGVVQPLLVRFEHHPRLYSALVPYEMYHFSKTLEIGFAFMLIYLSFNLYMRKRAAWTMSLVINGLSAILQLLRIGSEHSSWLANRMGATDLPSYSAIPPIIGCLFLILLQNHFRVRSEPRSVRFALLSSLVLVAVAIGYGTLGFWLLDKVDFGTNFTLQSCFERALNGITQLGNADLTARTKYALWFVESLQLVGYLTPLIILLSLFRPINYKLNTLPHERHRAEEILNQYGRTSLDRYKLLPDKSYFFSADGQCFIAYKTENAVAISLGDPVGPPEKIPAAIKQFRNFCHANGWTCAFMQTPPEFVPIYEEQHLNVLKIGEDGVVDLEKFCKTTSAKKTFKGAVKKLDKAGYKVTKCAGPHTETDMNELQAVSDEWLSLPGRRERGFSLGKFERTDLKNDMIFKLVAPDGKVLAFVNQVRSYHPGETTIDLMRHRVEVPNGAMDYLFVKMLLILKEEGYKQFSLGLAALSGVGTENDATIEERAVHQIYENMNRFFAYKGLRNYKEKFDPDWVSRYLVYEGSTPGLVRTTLAIVKATED